MKKDGDKVKAGVFEVSDDGNTWTTISEPKGGSTVVVNMAEAPVQARMLRYRITEANPRWMAICEFTVNRGMPSYATTNIAKCPKVSAFRDKDTAGINRIMEVFPMAPGEFLDLEFPSPVQAEWLEINLENANLAKWATVELTLEGGKKSVLKAEVVKNRLYLTAKELPQERISSVRLTNTGNAPEEIKLTLFRVGIPEQQADLNPYTLVDEDLCTFYNCGKEALNTQVPLPANTKSIIVVGTAEVSINGDEGQPHGDHCRIYTVPAGVNRVNVYAPKQDGKRVYEVIFMH